MKNRLNEEFVALATWSISVLGIAIFGSVIAQLQPTQTVAVLPGSKTLEIGHIDEIDEPIRTTESKPVHSPVEASQSDARSPADPPEPDAVPINSNPIEPAQKPNQELTQQEIDEAINRYRSALKEGKTEIRIGATSPFDSFDWMGNRYALSARNGTPTSGTMQVIVDRNGRATPLSSGGLMVRLDNGQLPFDSETVAMNLIGSRNVDAAVVLYAEIELELYRSLFRYLQPQGLRMPKAGCTYEAILARDTTAGALQFVWSDNSNHTHGGQQ